MTTATLADQALETARRIGSQATTADFGAIDYDRDAAIGEAVNDGRMDDSEGIVPFTDGSQLRWVGGEWVAEDTWTQIPARDDA